MGFGRSAFGFWGSEPIGLARPGLVDSQNQLMTSQKRETETLC